MGDVKGKLDKKNRNFMLDWFKLRIGDILLIHGTKVHSRIIQYRTDSHYSHAILYLGDETYIDATTEGVHASSIHRFFFKKIDDVKVLRLKEWDASVALRAVEHTRKEVGKEYSKKNAVAAEVEHPFGYDENRQFCSRLVAESYSVAGCFIEDPDECSPATLENSPLFVTVDDCVRGATSVDHYLADTEDLTLVQAEVENEVLKEVRKVTGEDLQTINQVVKHLIVHRGDDKKVVQCFEESSFFRLFDAIVERNPRKFDEIKFYDQVEKDLCISVKEADYVCREFTKLKKRFEKEKRSWTINNRNLKLEFCRINLSHYKRVIGLLESSIRISKGFLNRLDSKVIQSCLTK